MSILKEPSTLDWARLKLKEMSPLGAVSNL